MGVYRLDGKDIEATYGVIVREVKGLFDFPKRKGKTAHSWLDSNGEEHYTTGNDIYFEARDIHVFCTIHAASREEFISSLEEFQAALIGPGLHTFEVPYTDRVYHVYFRDGCAFDMLTTWNANELIGKCIITLREPNPAIPGA